MPHPQQNDQHIEYTYKETKYTVGQKIKRFGMTMVITRIEKDKKDDGWHIYAQPAQ